MMRKQVMSKQKRAIQVLEEIALWMIRHESTSPPTLLISDSICKYATTDRQCEKIELLALPGKDINNVINRITPLDYLHLYKYETVILHLGTVNVLNVIQKNHYQDTKVILSQYQNLIDVIKYANKNINILISGLIPMVNELYTKRGVNNFIREINTELKATAINTPRTVFIKTYNLFMNKGLADPSRYRKDGVHPSDNDYIRFVKSFGHEMKPEVIIQKRQLMANTNSQLE